MSWCIDVALCPLSLSGCGGHGDHVNSSCVPCYPLRMAAGELAGGICHHGEYLLPMPCE